MNTVKNLSLLLSFGFLASACSTPVDGQPATEEVVQPAVPPVDDGRFHVKFGCTRTACDEVRHAASEACSDCEQDAVESYISSYHCSSLCSEFSRTCSDEQRAQCTQEGFIVTLPAEMSEELFDACGAYETRLKGCKTWAKKPDHTVCDTVARTRKPELASSYAALAHGSCKLEFSTCFPPEGTLGHDVCGEASKRCGFNTCKGVPLNEIDTASDWLLPDVSAALRECGNRDCGEVQACVKTWASAVF